MVMVVAKLVKERLKRWPTRWVEVPDRPLLPTEDRSLPEYVGDGEDLWMLPCCRIGLICRGGREFVIERM